MDMGANLGLFRRPPSARAGKSTFDSLLNIFLNRTIEEGVASSSSYRRAAGLTYQQVSNKRRKWDFTNYGRSLIKRKNQQSFFENCKLTKIKTTTTTSQSQSEVESKKETIVEYSACCCGSTCTSNDENNNNTSRQNEFKFTLSSYNLLAPDLARDNSYLYTNVPYHYVDWNYRRAKILDEIKYFESDIYCFQEMQEDEYFNFFYPKFKSLGYYCLFKKRTGDDKPDGCALIFKKRKFHLLSFEYVEYYSPNVESLNKENVAIIAMLRPKYGAVNEKLCVVTTHLIYSPKRGDVKLAQLQKLFANIDRVAFKRLKLVNNEVKIVYYPIVLCGDMNLTLNSTIYKFVTEARLLNYEQHPRNAVSGQLKHVQSSSTCLFRPLIPQELEINDHSVYTQELCKRLNELKKQQGDVDCVKIDHHMNNTYSHGSENLFHTFKFKSAYDLSCFNQTSESEVTTCLPKNHEKVDYIFFHSDRDDDSNEIVLDSDGEEVVKSSEEGATKGDDSNLELISVLKLYKKDDVENLVFPSRDIPSDHFLLSAKFSVLYK